jgi:hypothetical protein
MIKSFSNLETISVIASKKELPIYNDFLHPVFSNKVHKSYMLRERADIRTKAVEKKFQDMYSKQGADLQRIQSDFEQREKETNDKLEAREKQRKLMIL